MKKLVLMLVVILGVMACDKNESDFDYKQAQFSEFKIGPNANYITVGDLLDSENSVSYYKDDIFVVIYNTVGVKYSISLEDDYGLIKVFNCSVDNRDVDYDYFKLRIFKAYINAKN